MLKNRNSLWQILFQIEPGKPAIARGMRAAVTTVLPIVVALFTGWTGLTWTAVGGFETTLADVGGLYRTKSIAMGMVAFGGAFSVFVGTLVGGTPILAVLLMFLWTFSCGLAAVYGNAINTGSNLVAAMFLIAIGFPANFATALQRSILFLIGGILAMFLSLVLWPLRPYKLVQKVVEDCYGQLSGFMTASFQLTETLVSEDTRNHSLGQKRIKVREALASARSALWATRATRLGASVMGEGLLGLTEIADQVFVSAHALAEVLEGDRSGQAWERVQLPIQHVIEQLCECCRALAVTFSASGNASINLEELDRTLNFLKGELRQLRQAASKQELDYSVLLVIAYTVGILDRLAGYLHSAFEITAGLREGRRSELSPNRTLSNLEWNHSRFVAKLRDNLTLDSVVLRHALRLGVTAAVAVIVYSVFGLKEGYWVTLTVVVILKPYSRDTFQRGVQRVVGTVFGGILAAVLASLIRTPLIMACVLFPLTVITISLQPLNYGFYAFFLTSQVVLMDNILEPGNWHLAIDRIQDTAIGGVLALIGGYVLWPSREHMRISDRFAASIEANCIYFQDVLSKYLGQESGRQSLQVALEQVRLENTNAEASFQRLLSEPYKRQGNLEAMMAVITYIQQFSNAVTTLAAHLSEWSGHHQLTGLEKFTRQIEVIMADLANSLRNGIPPQSLPVLEETQNEISAHLQELHARRMVEFFADQGHTPIREAVLDYTLVGIEVKRITRIVTILHSAVSRMSDVEP